MSARLKARKEAELLKTAARAAELTRAAERERAIPAELAMAIRQRGFGDWSHTGAVVERVAAHLRLSPAGIFPAALERLLLHVYARAPRLLDEEPWYGRKWTLPALIRVGAHSHLWIRPPEGWQPERAGPEEQFGQLVRFLFACYPVPPFMEAVFYEGDRFPVEWFFHVGTGQNIRTAAGLPVTLTKKMAHEMMLATHERSLVHAVRWGQVVGLGGSQLLARQLRNSRLGDRFLEASEEEWWGNALHWFVNHLNQHVIHAVTVFDYLWARRYGHPANGQRADRAFTLKGRTLASVLRLVEEWHVFLNAGQSIGPNRRFPESGLSEGNSLAGADSGSCTWTLREVRTMHELREEGQQMGHCVYMYADRILRRECAIWSLRAAGRSLSTHGLTLEVCLRRRAIVQARGRFNRLPTAAEREFFRQWAEENDLGICC